MHYVPIKLRCRMQYRKLGTWCMWNSRLGFTDSSSEANINFTIVKVNGLIKNRFIREKAIVGTKRHGLSWKEKKRELINYIPNLIFKWNEKKLNVILFYFMNSMQRVSIDKYTYNWRIIKTFNQKVYWNRSLNKTYDWQ